MENQVQKRKKTKGGGVGEISEVTEKYSSAPE